MTYSIAGPSVISTRHFGTGNLGENVIFQDFLGLGVNLGKKQAVNIALKMVHYSNGDFFVDNAGFDVPIVLSIGYNF